MHGCGVRAIVIVFTCVLLLLPACVAVDTGIPRPEKNARWLKTELYFGIAIIEPGGRQITPAEWEAFFQEEIAPRFPGGVTVSDAAAQWSHPDGTRVKETAKVVTAVYRDSKERRRIPDEIIALYKKRFNRRSVMRVTMPVDVRTGKN